MSQTSSQQQNGSNSLSETDFGFPLPAKSSTLQAMPFYAKFKSRCEKLNSKLVRGKSPSGCNYFQQVLRIFTLGANTLSSENLRQDCTADFILSCYVFKFRHPHREGYTHGLFLKLAGFAPRKLFDSFAHEVLEFLVESDCEDIKLKAVTPTINSRISIFDYLQSLYVLSKNLLVNYGCSSDAIPEGGDGNGVDHCALNKTTRKMKKITEAILDNVISMPNLYPGSRLCQVLSFNRQQYKEYMRYTTITKFVIDVCQDSYNYALQSKDLVETEVQHLMDPLTRSSLVNRFIAEPTTKRIQMLLHQHFELVSFVHPSPCIALAASDLQQKGVFEGLLFDPRFLISVLMCARWFARTCLQDTEFLANNNAHLLLYGQAGAGKSLLLSVISSNVPTYKFLTSGRFQNPDVLSSALIFIDEFDTLQLLTNQYKSLLDINGSVKVDFKNLHPENISQDVPCIISTNDEILSVLRSAPSRKLGTTVNYNSVEAAIRRLYIVPFKLGQYDKMHGPIYQGNPRFNELSCYNGRFQGESDKLDRMFNLIMAFSLFQPDNLRMSFNPASQQYLERVVADFADTAFCQFYFDSKDKIDELIYEVERNMMLPDINDSEYQAHVTMAVGRLEYSIKKFVKSRLRNTKKFSAFKDGASPWPIRTYQLLEDDIFKENIRSDAANNQGKMMTFLNRDVSALIFNKQMQPFVIDDDYDDALSITDLHCNEVLDPVLAKMNIFAVTTEREQNFVLGVKRARGDLNLNDFFRDPFEVTEGCEDEGNDESLYTQWKRLKKFQK